MQPRLLLSVILVSSYASGNSDRAAIQAALDAAQSQPGSTVQFDARSYSIDGTLLVHSQTTLMGTPNNGTILNFNLSGAAYGMTIDGGASNVTIQALNMISSSGVIGMYGSGTYTNIHITGNSLQFGGGSTANGTAIFGIYGTSANNGLQITSNYFHDSPSSVRDWEIWEAQDAHLDYNTLVNVTDGGHTCEPQDNVSYSHNFGVNLRRMGQEIQGTTASAGLKVNYNTFYDWVSPYYDSFGLSIVNHNSTGTEIGNNFLNADIAAGSDWGIADGGGAHRFGYAIEAGGTQMITPSAGVHDNTIVGNWIAGVVASRLNVYVTNNAKYGPANWGDWIGEPSVDGYGSVVLSGDTVNRDTTVAPSHPQITDPAYVYNPGLDGTPAAQLPTFTGDGTTGSPTGSTSPGTITTTSPTTTGGGTTTTGGGTTTTGGGTVTTLGPQNTGLTAAGETVIGSAVEIDPAADTTRVTGTLGTLQVTALSATTAKLTWTQQPSLVGTNNTTPSIALFEVDVQSTVGKEHFPSVLYTADLTSATVINLHPGWQIDFTASAYTTDGKLYRSGPKTVLMPGNSLSDFTGLLWGGISSIHTPHS